MNGYCMTHQDETNEDFNQMLLLDENARIVESCETLFNTEKLHRLPVVKWSPFVESIFDYLLTLKSGSPEILFSRVEEPLPELQGFYDFTFGAITIHGKKYIIWTIFDHTNLYKELQRTQQRMHEIELQRQNLDYKIHQTIQKNLNLQRKIIKNKDKPLLVQANNLILKNILNDLEQLADLMRKSFSNSLAGTFSLPQLLDKIKDNYKQSNTNRLLITLHAKVPKTLTGDSTRLMYILGDLLHASNLSNSISSYIKVNLTSNSSAPKKLLEFTIFNAQLFISQVNSTSDGEISHSETSPIQLRISVIQKLVELQAGIFKSINSSPKGTYFQFYLPFVAAPQ